MGEDKDLAHGNAEFFWETEVAWGHTDAAGFVFYPNYFAWFDEATHHFVGSFGQSSAELFSTKRIGLPLLEASIQFVAPLHFGDPIMVSTVVHQVGNKSMELSHDIISRGNLIARGREKRAWVVFRDSGPVAIPIPDMIRHQFNEKIDRPS